MRSGWVTCDSVMGTCWLLIHCLGGKGLSELQGGDSIGQSCPSKASNLVGKIGFQICGSDSEILVPWLDFLAQVSLGKTETGEKTFLHVCASSKEVWRWSYAAYF